MPPTAEADGVGSTEPPRRQERWRTRLGLVLAMAGNAVGLGNFLRFPAQAAQNGGGAFLLPYLASFVLLGLPLLWVEWALGRFGGRYGHHSTPGMFDRLGRSRALKYIGVLGLFSNLAIAAYYMYIESWALAYTWHSLRGSFAVTAPKPFFEAFVGAESASVVTWPGEAMVFFAVTLAANVWILARGVSRGIESAALVLMPVLLLFGAVLAVFALTLKPGENGVIESPWLGMDFLWQPRVNGLTDPKTWLQAAGQVFFTLSLGMGSIHCYASYLGRNEDIALNASAAGWLNEFVEVVLGGTVLLSLSVAYLGLTVVQKETAGGSGFALGFLTLPSFFQNFGVLSPFVGALWFGLLFFAGITSSLAMGQPIIAFLHDELGATSRTRSAVAFGVFAGALGLVCVCLYPAGVLDEFDFWTGTFALVAFGFLEVVVFLRAFGIDGGWSEITRGAEMRLPRCFKWILGYVTPGLLGCVFVAALVKPEQGDWARAFDELGSGHWPFAEDSVVGRIAGTHGDSRWWNEGLTPSGARALARTLLVGLFLGCALAVRRAWQGRVRS